MLAAALLAGSAATSLGLRRATSGVTAVARADWEGRRALGELLVAWDAAADSLPVGASLERPLPAPDAGGAALVRRARVRRLTSRVYSASVAVRLGSASSALAYRRVRVLLERRFGGDSTDAAAPPSPIARWSVVELH
jgi:hypothetical protein